MLSHSSPRPSLFLLGLPSLVSSTRPPQPSCKVLRRRCCETRAEIHFDPLREVTGAGRTAGFIANRLGTVSRGFGRAHRAPETGIGKKQGLPPRLGFRPHSPVAKGEEKWQAGRGRKRSAPKKRGHYRTGELGARAGALRFTTYRHVRHHPRAGLPQSQKLLSPKTTKRPRFLEPFPVCELDESFSAHRELPVDASACR